MAHCHSLTSHQTLCILTSFLRQNEISFNTHLLVIAYYTFTNCAHCDSSLVPHVRADDGLIEKGPKHVVCLLTPYTLIKFCCVLTYPLYVIVTLSSDCKL